MDEKMLILNKLIEFRVFDYLNIFTTASFLISFVMIILDIYIIYTKSIYCKNTFQKILDGYIPAIWHINLLTNILCIIFLPFIPVLFYVDIIPEHIIHNTMTNILLLNLNFVTISNNIIARDFSTLKNFEKINIKKYINKIKYITVIYFVFYVVLIIKNLIDYFS
jgi:hypothetical protein